MLKQIYFIGILPPFQVAEQISALRKNYLQGFNEASEHKKFPHITLQHTFRKTLEELDFLHEKLNMIATFFSPFSIGTGRFGHFDKRIIYISVHYSVVLNSLYQQIHSTLQNEMHFADNELSNSFLPHITLEKKLTPAQFQQGWNVIQHIETNYIFEVDSFYIFKHDGKKWIPDSTFKMKNQ